MMSYLAKASYPLSNLLLYDGVLPGVRPGNVPSLSNPNPAPCLKRVKIGLVSYAGLRAQSTPANRSGFLASVSRVLSRTFGNVSLVFPALLWPAHTIERLSNGLRHPFSSGLGETPQQVPLLFPKEIGFVPCPAWAWRSHQKGREDLAFAPHSCGLIEWLKRNFLDLSSLNCTRIYVH